MADGEFDERTPLMQHTDDGGDDDAANTTGPFQPGAASTPGPSGESYPMRTTTTNRPPERSGTAETFHRGDPIRACFELRYFKNQGGKYDA